MSLASHQKVITGAPALILVIPWCTCFNFNNALYVPLASSQKVITGAPALTLIIPYIINQDRRCMSLASLQIFITGAPALTLIIPYTLSGCLKYEYQTAYIAAGLLLFSG